MVTVVSGQPAILVSPGIAAPGPPGYRHRTLRGVEVGHGGAALAEQCERLRRRWAGRSGPLEEEPTVAAYHAFYRTVGLDTRRNRL
ncbi:MAG: hypothetical protein M3203_09820, partial [Actinomycetota bacterium]|nr:hypothetical protein [Actinomycetota bacterium]